MWEVLNRAFSVFDEYVPEVIKRPFYYALLIWLKEAHLLWSWRFWEALPVVVNHSDFTTLKEYDLAVLRNSVEPEEFIEAALKRAKGCHFIIFQASETQYVQFWIKEGTYLFNFPLAEKADHEPYLYHVIGTLSLHGFYHYGSTDKKRELGAYQYELRSTPDFDEIVADFGKDRAAAAKVASYIFSEIFEEDLSDVRASVG